MDVFSFLDLIGGLSLFLFGMTLMGQALERRAGAGLRGLLARLTKNRFTGLLTGLVITAIIQSSSATTVMVVGFVNSGILSLTQSIGVIMGANIGTTVTAWILSLAGIQSDVLLLRLLNPSSFTPVLALLGIILILSSNTSKKKDSGLIFLGFSILIFGMNMMSSSVAGLQDVPAFRHLFLAFSHPLLGVLAGALLTAIIQSSSASVGILQALSTTGQVTYAAVIPIIMGQNIGTCVTALLSSIGTNRNAKRAALVHLCFNVIGTGVWLSVFSLIKYAATPAILGQPASLAGIAVSHTLFNILCTALLFPFAGGLEKLVYRLIPKTPTPEATNELDERLFATPKLALAQCKKVMTQMAEDACSAVRDAIHLVHHYDKKQAASIREREEATDSLEDSIGTYLFKLSSRAIGDRAAALAGEYMKLLGDFERMADHAVNIVEAAEEINLKQIAFSPVAKEDFHLLTDAVNEIMGLVQQAFLHDDLQAAMLVEPLEQVINELKEGLRTQHIIRLQNGKCSMNADFVWSDLLTDLERIADHCSNIAGSMIDTSALNMNMHATLRGFRETSEDYRTNYMIYRKKYEDRESRSGVAS